MGQLNVSAILPNLSRFFTIPTPTEEILALLEIVRDDNSVHDAPLWHIFSKPGVSRKPWIKFGPFWASTVRLRRSRTTACTIAINLLVPRIVVTTTLFIFWDRVQRG